MFSEPPVPPPMEQQFDTDQLAALHHQEQFTSGVLDFARTVGKYYVELLQGGLSMELASALTARFHDLFWQRTLFYRATPSTEKQD